MGVSKNSHWLTCSITLSLASLSVYLWIKKSNWDSKDEANEKIEQLEASLKAALKKCAAERQGRIRAQKDLREALSTPRSDNLESVSISYPMAPIAFVRSCFSTRNGTPRQPLLVPLARASLIFDPSRVPQASLEGLEGYSHCWIIYVFHLNTDLEKLWRHPSQSKFKAKVRVPRLKGERIGVFATRTPHRPCPIGLTVAKVEAVMANMVLLSGVDLVDGTPILDIKPYLPYCDSIEGATVPKWVKADNALAVASVSFSESFQSVLEDCRSLMEKKSLYASSDELVSLIRQVLAWDIRSVSQRSHPHKPTVEERSEEDEIAGNGIGLSSFRSDEVVYHLMLEGLDISYKIDHGSNVFVEDVSVSPQFSQTKSELDVMKG